MALLQWNKRMFRNCVLMLILVFSVTPFLIFTLYAYMVPHEPNDLMQKARGSTSEDSQLHLQLTKKIHDVEDKIRITPKNNLFAMLNESKKNKSHFIVTQNKGNHMSLEWVKSKPNYHVHIFYYPWYQNEKIDGIYAHWNHELLPHWSEKTPRQRRHHIPPDDIGANFYPKLGPYSSADPKVVNVHMQQIRTSGAGVLAVSWYPPHNEQTSETPVDNLIKMLLDSADKYELKIAFHIEPFKNRSGATFRETVEYIFIKYGNHSAFYRTEFNGRQLPVFYIYDSYQIEPSLWAEALTKEGKYSIRDTAYDGIFLGLLVEPQHFDHLTTSGFDGFYTYFASNGFVYGSTWENWPVIADEAKRRDLIFVPSIGPGYLDTRVRSWNGQNTKLRLSGRYYKSAFQSALAMRPQFLTITSFNEWHEGTQIEPAVPKAIKNYKYEDYRPNTPEFYLNLTHTFVEEYHNMSEVLQLHLYENTFQFRLF